jgi:OmpA-OmpF porin, OOP family
MPSIGDGWRREFKALSRELWDQQPLLLFSGLVVVLALAITCALHHSRELLPVKPEVSSFRPGTGVVADPAKDKMEIAPAVLPAAPVSANGNGKREQASELLLKIARVLCCTSIEFEEKRPSLTPNGKQALDSLVPFFAEHQTLQLFIDGHTDTVGSPAGNQELSLARANAARDYMISRGLKADQLVARGFGGDQPVADNASEEGRRRNRRIEFRL